MPSLAKIDAKIGEIRRKLAEAIAERRKLYDRADALEDQIESATEDTDTSALQAELREVSDQIVRASDDIRLTEGTLQDLAAQRADRAEANRQEADLNRATDRQTDPETPANRATDQVRVLPPTAEEQDHDLACFIRANYLGRTNGVGVAAVCNGVLGDQYRNERLSAAITTSGSPHIIPENYSNRLIELLRARTVVRSMTGVRTPRLLNGNLRIPRQSGASTATYVDEMQYIPLSTPTTDQITLAAKKLTAMVIQSGEIMRRSDPDSNRMVLDDLIAVIARKEDATFLRATGTTTVPSGLKDFADDASATQVITANATVNLANVTVDLGKLLLALATANCPMLNPYFIMHPRSERFLMDLRDGNGNLAFPELMNGRLRGHPYKTTTQIPTNLGGGDETEIYLVDASELIIADAPTTMLDISTEAAYDDGGTVKAAFSQDAAVVRAIREHDTAIRHNESVAYLTGVTWGSDGPGSTGSA